MKDTLVPNPQRHLPDNYHSRTGHSLPTNSSEVFKQLQNINIYARENEMVLNFNKTKLMTFNACQTLDFMPEFVIDGHEIQHVEEIKLLGIIIRSDMKWHSNTKNMVTRGFQRLWMLRRLKALGATEEDLLDVYVKQVRSILEYAAPAWHSAITEGESIDIERVQRTAFHIILGSGYKSYRAALVQLDMKSLSERRVELCKKFAVKSSKHPKHSKWFSKNDRISITRQTSSKFKPVWYRTKRFEDSPLTYLTRLLNATYT